MKNNFNLKNKFALGSASFVQNYSLYKKKISLNEVKKILSEMIKNNIFMVDTAKRYGDLYNIFSEKKFKKIDFIFKISKFNTFDDIINQIESFKKKTNRDKIYSILFHSLNDLKKKKNVKFYSILKKNKKKYNISKVGFSVNSFNGLEKFLKKLNPEIIQVPFSIMDRRILQPEYQKILKKKNIEVHIRSIFLRGLLVKRKFNQINFSKENLKKLNKLHDFYKINKLDPLKTCIQFVLKYKFYKKIIIGVDSLNHFKSIVKFKSFKLDNKNLTFSRNETLIMPSKWKLNE